MTGGENSRIVDNIHNYQIPKSKRAGGSPADLRTDLALVQAGGPKQGGQHALEKKPRIEEGQLEAAMKVLQHERTARLIGLIAHLAYWNVFGHFNQLPLDMYHRK